MSSIVLLLFIVFVVCFGFRFKRLFRCYRCLLCSCLCRSQFYVCVFRRSGPSSGRCASSARGGRSRTRTGSRTALFNIMVMTITMIIMIIIIISISVLIKILVILICMIINSCPFSGWGCLDQSYLRMLPKTLGWHYLSNATCLMRPHLFTCCLQCQPSLYNATLFAAFEENLY